MSVKFKVNDLNDKALPYLNDKVKEALKSKLTQTIMLNNDMSVKYKVLYFGTKVSVLEVGIKKICERLNEISKDHEIKGFLGPIIECPLASVGTTADETLVLAYIGVNADSYCKLIDSAYTFNMGSTPERYLETEEDLKDVGIIEKE